MAPFALGAAGWLFGPPWGMLAVELTVVWGGAVLAFLAGVRRGLSFTTAGGATAAKVASSSWLFALAFGALAMPWAALRLVLLLAGFVSLGILDRRAAQRGEAPPFFARLRPIQMLIPIAALAALLPRTAF